ncbi:heme NO-binding domain-containing protein [Nocardioides aurantiacus]|uniref:Heme-NO-binding protein n=1 Tax=Nocardioides aurantiacus TaxID=86796 RepID=A0A3N2CXR0_9ACTN|nr:heme NO-binding domain-containing protein [Nocardioides aurantiacus]ROR92004.1 heme-NO-binding protein [Nocardioides aurantiacus]
MKGVILNLVEEAVVLAHGDEVWDTLLERAGLEGAWTSLGSYPDEELPLLVEAGAQLFDVAPEELARDLGRHAARGLAQRHPEHFARCEDTLGFLRTLDEVVHREVRKLHPDASPPRFTVTEVAGPVPGGGRALDVHYRSARRLCWLAVGMIEGTGTVYGETTEVRHQVCQLHDAPQCTLRVTTRTG